MAEEIKKVVEQTETAVVLDNNSAEKVIESTTIIQEKVETNTKRFLSEKGLNNLMIMFFSTLLTLLCLLPIGYLLTKKIPKPVGIIDLQLLVNENQNAILTSFSNSSEITEEQRAAAIKKTQEFTSKLNKAVAEKATECQCVLINKAAVLADKPSTALVDYTDEIRKEIK